jgi:hypothetical protein
MQTATDITQPDEERAHSAMREIRLQASIVRALLDEVDGVNRHQISRSQLLEELARLGCRLLETAAALSAGP